MKKGDNVKIEYRYGKKGRQLIYIEYGTYLGIAETGIFKGRKGFHCDNSSYLHLKEKDIIKITVI